MPAKRILDNRVDVSVDGRNPGLSDAGEHAALRDFFEHAGIGMQWIDADGREHRCTFLANVDGISICQTHQCICGSRQPAAPAPAASSETKGGK